ncbi:MAG: hypothetical protein CMB80_20040 [Flammeovirgaceae bacterium]|nr:hypothetical protein [Flammeovirgaceae bacterium]MBR06560.1 hypothetical protein [Rickettsiales bacterium]HCX21114.1 hypothetical protein [Cytophagales bacterium]|tara:strand:- start:874 stop:1446 length:573 start_codon:yes stop_codon:yes gene_type:complete
MKNYLPLLLICVSLASCVSERDFIVEYDYSYRGKFKQYNTFNFLNLGDTVNFNGLSDKLIRDEIERRMVSQGYKLSNKPSLYVAYKVFSNDMKFKGYEQMELESWDQFFAKKAENEYNLEYIKEAQYNTRDYELKEGTLLIDFIDRKSHGVIWQGYASGLFDDKTYFSKDVKYAVRSILNQYRLLAASFQ